MLRCSEAAETVRQRTRSRLSHNTVAWLLLTGLALLVLQAGTVRAGAFAASRRKRRVRPRPGKPMFLSESSTPKSATRLRLTSNVKHMCILVLGLPLDESGGSVLIRGERDFLGVGSFL